MCVCVCITESLAIHLKLTQYCKPTISQFKRKSQKSMRINNSIENEQMLQVIKHRKQQQQKIEYLVNMKKVIQFADNQGKVC